MNVTLRVNGGTHELSIDSRLTLLDTLRDVLGLDAIDTLISNPAWQPGTPVLEDLRDCEWTPPPPALEECRAQVARRQPMLNGCRWAVVIRGGNPTVASILDAAADDATHGGVVLKRFTSTIDAHLWLKLPAAGSKA